MQALQLSPLPSLRFDDRPDRVLPQDQGFVDDAVVLALLNGPVSPRKLAEQSDLALSSDAMDFAGWRLPVALPQQATAAIRRPAPPVTTESGIGEPHCGSHRWWLAGLAGALSTLVFSLLLLSLSSRGPSASGELTTIQPPAPKPLEKSRSTESRRDAPQLSDATPLR